MNKVKLLAEIVLDKTAYEAERDDAIGYLGDYDDEIVQETLIKFISDKEEDYVLKDLACESLAGYWKRTQQYDKKKLYI